MFENHLNPGFLVFIGVLLDESQCAKVSVIFKVFAPFCIGQISHHQQHYKGLRIHLCLDKVLLVVKVKYLQHDRVKPNLSPLHITHNA